MQYVLVPVMQVFFPEIYTHSPPLFATTTKKKCKLMIALEDVCGAYRQWLERDRHGNRWERGALIYVISLLLPTIPVPALSMPLLLLILSSVVGGR